MDSNNSPIIIFGNGEIAKLAHYFFNNYSNYNVAGFVTDNECLNDETFLKLPLINFNKVSIIFPPSRYKAFIAISYNKQNFLREKNFIKFKSLGYNFVSFIH